MDWLRDKYIDWLTPQTPRQVPLPKFDPLFTEYYQPVPIYFHLWRDDPQVIGVYIDKTTSAFIAADIDHEIAFHGPFDKTLNLYRLKLTNNLTHACRAHGPLVHDPKTECFYYRRFKKDLVKTKLDHKFDIALQMPPSRIAVLD